MERLTLREWQELPKQDELYTRLAELEDKLESGQLVELPCKVGDMFWAYAEGKKLLYRPIQYIVKGIELRSDGIYLITIYDIRFKLKDEAALTMEQAEARLKELQEKL